MKDYFLLQFRMISRKLDDLGIHPVLGYFLGLVAFVLMAEYIFYKTEFAPYVMILMASSFLLTASEVRRTDFLKMTFGNRKTTAVRMIENAVICLPFSIVLLYHQAFLESTLLLIGGVAMALLSFKNSFSYALPTPFSRKPFEFSVGLRNTYFVIAGAYILTVIAISVHNFNLGIFALLLVFVISLTFFLKPENEYFVWSYSSGVKEFLFEKIRIATLYAGLLAVPIAAALLVFYIQYALIILACVMIGYAFLWSVILAKYSAYPYEMNVPQAILLAICIVFPPLLLAVIPFFYTKAVKTMKIRLG